MASIISAGVTSNTALNLSADTTGILQLASNGSTTALTINTSQNVGIGTTSPTARLTVVTGSSGNNEGVIRLSDNATYYAELNRVNATDEFRIGSYGPSQNLTFYTVNSERMRIDSSGNVGIGTSSPAILGGNYKNLVLQGASTTNGGYYFTQTSDGAQVGQVGVDTGVIYIGSRSNHPTAFTTNNTERMRIDSSGQLLVNLTTAAVTANIQASCTGSDSNIFVRNTTATTGYFLWGNANSADKLLCAQTGTINNATGTYGTISDAKLKENIVDATPKLNEVLQLQVRNFNFIGDELKQLGFVAQEIEQVFPSLVEEHIKRDENGKETGEVIKSVKTSIFIPILVKAIQEQQAMIEELKAEVALLKSK